MCFEEVIKVYRFIVVLSLTREIKCDIPTQIKNWVTVIAGGQGGGGGKTLLFNL